MLRSEFAHQQGGLLLAGAAEARPILSLCTGMCRDGQENRQAGTVLCVYAGMRV